MDARLALGEVQDQTAIQTASSVGGPFASVMISRALATAPD
jgi:hypothetical protein